MSVKMEVNACSNSISPRVNAAIDLDDYGRANNWILFAWIIYYVDLLFTFQRILAYLVCVWVLWYIVREHFMSRELYEVYHWIYVLRVYHDVPQEGR